jgi:hypothetical protein
MSALDRNKIFFGLLHYIFSEQKNVDWALKTSLVNFTGINSTVTDQKYEKESLSDDIIDYINSVKPYHVQFEQFIEKYSNKTDVCNIEAQDECNIEVGMRFDSVCKEVDEQGSMSDIEYMDTTAANRLWYIKHNVLTDDEMKAYLEDVLNCHFKGITVEGGEFDIDNFGYDTFLYDNQLYDAPTVSADYYITDSTEKSSLLTFPYEKSYIIAGVSTFSLKKFDKIGNLTVYRNGVEEEFSYNDNTKILSVFTKVKKDDKIYIINEYDGVRSGLVYAVTSFKESTDESDIRQFVDVNNTVFTIPDSKYGTRKTIVHIEYPNGTRIPTYNYERTSEGLLLKDELKEGYHVIITVIDYGQLYDKIYTYEDCYGQSNNLITLDGNEFLRPFYEQNRPSELIAVYPNEDLKICTESNGTISSLFNVDHKGENSDIVISKSMITELARELNIGDKTIRVKNIKKLKLPYVDDSDVKIPGKILIGSEIIEFYDYDASENLLKSIRRGSGGSYITEKHLKGSTVYTYNEQTKKVYDYTLPSISAVCLNGNQEYEIPNGYKSESKLTVWKKSHISLLTDIQKDGESFTIDSNNIILPNSSKNRKGILYVNGDKVLFETITTNRKKGVYTYTISNYVADKDYSANSSYIYSASPEKLSVKDYTISEDKTHIILNEKPLDNEIIIVENEL